MRKKIWIGLTAILLAGSVAASVYQREQPLVDIGIVDVYGDGESALQGITLQGTETSTYGKGCSYTWKDGKVKSQWLEEEKNEKVNMPWKKAFEDFEYDCQYSNDVNNNNCKPYLFRICNESAYFMLTVNEWYASTEDDKAGWKEPTEEEC